MFYARKVKRKNTLVKGTREVGEEKNSTLKRMRVGNLTARKKEFAIKKERVEVGTITLVALIAT